MTKYIIYAAVAALCLSSCQHDDDPAVTKGFRIKAYVGDADFSRSTPRPDDGFSVEGFDGTDVAGFYSQSGDRDNSNGPFDNRRMEFQGGYFVNEAMSVDVNSLGKTLLYFPYSSADNGRQPIRGDNDEVIDILYSTSVGQPDNLDKNALSARFSHLFAMLIIDGGSGFENFHTKDVSVTMSEPVATVEFPRTANPDDKYGYWIRLNGEYKDQGIEPDESFAMVKGHYDETRERYYVIVPTDDGNTGDGVYVKTINVVDDSGRSHKIKCNKWVQAGVRYPLTLELNELVPTIYPHEITLWDEGGDGSDLSANEATGIDNATDFKVWIEEYNKLSPNEDVLLRYGDKVVVVGADGQPTGEEYWRFYLTADIDLSDEHFSTASHMVDRLEDEFDGRGHTITGLSFKDDNPALFQTVRGDHACVKNLAVDGMVVNAKAVDQAVGALVTEFNSGVIENCTFTNLSMHALKSAVGVLAGTIGAGAEVRNCRFSGAIFGISTVEKIVGSGTVSDEVRKGCDVSNVMFGQI